jgi:hypothetical protein
MNKKSLRQMFIDLDLHPDEEVLTTFTVYGHLSSRLGLWPWSVSEKVRYELSRRDKIAQEWTIGNNLEIPAHHSDFSGGNVVLWQSVGTMMDAGPRQRRIHPDRSARMVHCAACGTAHISGSMCPRCYGGKK